MLLLAKIDALVRTVVLHKAISEKNESLKNINKLIIDDQVESEKIYTRVVDRGRLECDCIKSYQKASYVLTSIKRWKRPVSSALFTVQMPSSFQSPRFTYQDYLTSVHYNNETGHVVYSFEMKDLYPDTEFDVYWDKTPKLSVDQIGLLNKIDHSTDIETAFY